MDFDWVALAFGDVAWIGLAFVLGFAVKLISLPPLVGFLAAGFILNAWGMTSGELLQKLADLGITLLLFSIGLKMNPRILLKPQVWAVTGLHIGFVVTVFGSGLLLLAGLSTPLLMDMDVRSALLIAFALSFSSTVFVVKALEEKGEMTSLYGRIAISILIVQDLAAVAFLASTGGYLPSPWALLLLLLIPFRLVLYRLLQQCGHGELLVLFGLVLALGGAKLFELVGVKGDLGALVVGLLISSHPKSSELAKSILGFKDLFLVGFFLSIGMTGRLTIEAAVAGLLLVPLIAVKSIAFYGLMTGFKLRARTSLLATINLSNYSEFGLIVVAIAVSNGWLHSDWLVVLAVAMSLSFICAAPLSVRSDRVYNRWQPFWTKYQRKERLPDDQLLDIGQATIAIFGMGRVGTGAYDAIAEQHGDTVVGIDFDVDQVKHHQQLGRNVVRGAPTDADFWEMMRNDHSLQRVMLALPNLTATLDALELLRASGFNGQIVATARYQDEEEPILAAGANDVFNIYAEAGSGFAEHVESLPPAT